MGQRIVKWKMIYVFSLKFIDVKVGRRRGLS